MSSPGDLNGVPVSAPEAPQDGLRERGSFIVFGRALGPSPFTDPGFAHHANSEFVDLSREYEYPLQYLNLKGLGLISAVGFGCLYIAGDANMLKQPETVLLVVVGFLALLFAGCFFCCVNCLHFLCAPASPPQLLSRTELRHLLGTTACTFWTILLLVAGGLKHFITAQPGERWLEEALFIIESFGAIVVLVPSWYLVNRFSKEPVKAGLIMSMFWAGAIFSAECAGIFNTLLLLIWTAADPDCNATMPVGPKWPMEAPSGGCVAKANLEWVLTPGIVEESFKFMVLLRLVTSLEEAMKSKALTRFPRMSTISCMPCCGWFLKFAASPAVVVLCGMAAGAGFGSLENVQYIAKLSGVVKATGSILPASVRIFTAMLHIAMTGTCSFFLAISLFSQRKRPFVKFIGWIMMVIGHGSYDAFCTFQAEMPVDECFTRVECYDDKQREVCVFSRTGKLAECSCKDGVDEETRKCASNSTAVLVESEEAKVVLEVADAKKADVPIHEMQITQVTNVMATAGAIPGWYHGTTPKVVDWIHAALNASRTEKFWCAKELRESYVCGPAVVEWWPGAWTSWLLGTGIIVLFCLLACIGLPVVERDFHSRQQQAAAEAANPRGQVVQMA